jgi:hypothetical protein
MSGIAPAQGWTVIVSYNNFSVNGYKFFFGEYVSGRSIILGRGASVGFDYWNGSGQLITGAEAPVSAVVAVAGQTAYRNGSAETGTIPAWVGGSGVNLYIGKYRGADFGAIVNFAAVAIYNATLSAAQVLAVSNAMAALTG